MPPPSARSKPHPCQAPASGPPPTPAQPSPLGHTPPQHDPPTAKPNIRSTTSLSADQDSPSSSDSDLSDEDSAAPNIGGAAPSAQPRRRSTRVKTRQLFQACLTARGDVEQQKQLTFDSIKSALVSQQGSSQPSTPTSAPRRLGSLSAPGTPPRKMQDSQPNTPARSSFSAAPHQP